MDLKKHILTLCEIGNLKWTSSHDALGTDYIGKFPKLTVTGKTDVEVFRVIPNLRSIHLIKIGVTPDIVDSIIQYSSGLRIFETRDCLFKNVLRKLVIGCRKLCNISIVPSNQFDEDLRRLFCTGVSSAITKFDCSKNAYLTTETAIDILKANPQLVYFNMYGTDVSLKQVKNYVTSCGRQVTLLENSK